MAQQIELTAAELVFVQRMAPHFAAGKSVEEAARAVLDDDARLFESFCDRSHDVIVGSYSDHTGKTVRTAKRPGDLIASEITRTVYERLRSSEAGSAL